MTPENHLESIPAQTEVDPGNERRSAIVLQGSKLLRVDSTAAGTLRIDALHAGGEVIGRTVGFREGITCVPLESADRVDITVRHGDEVKSVELVEVPKVRINPVQPFAYPVVCGLASIPSRLGALKAACGSLLPQVDHLFVYLNGFDSVPGFLASEKITVFRSGDYGDYRDNSKYFGLRCLEHEVYFFSVDDDIEYPTDYVSSLVSAIERYKREAIVGVHGAIYGAGSRLFLDRAALHFRDPLEADLPVSALGTGTTAFHSSTLVFDCLEFAEVGMADLVLANVASEQGVPAISVARPPDWLLALDISASAQNLFTESILLDSAHDLFVRKGGVPGPGTIHRTIQGAPSVRAGLSSEAMALLAYLVALEGDVAPDSIAVPHSNLLVHLAERFRWPSLTLAVARGVALAQWPGRKSLALVTLPVRSRSLTMAESTFGSLMGLVDEQVAGITPVVERNLYEPVDTQAEEAALAAARAQGEAGLVLALLIMNLLAAGSPRALLRVYAELLRADMPEISAEVHKALSRLSPELSSEASLERASGLIQIGEVEEVLADGAALMETGYLGRQLVAAAGLEAGRAWSEDLVLSILTSAHNARQLRHVRELAKKLSKVPLPSCNPEVWVDHLPAMHVEVRKLAAAVLMTNQVWSERVPLDQLGLGDDTEVTLWRAAARAAMHGLSLQEARHAVNSVFIRSALLPVEVNADTGPGFFNALVAEPLPPWRDPSAPLVSIIMAVFNGQDTIEYALRSLLAQTYPNIEIVIVDDCSPVPLQLPDWARERPDIQLHRIDRNRGPYECRNVALARSSGEFIATQDADDWMHPQKIERQVRSLMGSNAVASYNRHIRLLASGAPALENNGRFMGDGPITSMFRRPLFDAIGGFMPVRTRGDMEFKSRIVHRYRKARIHHDDSVTLLALDSVTSNSKVLTQSAKDEQNMARFKRWYSIEQPVAYLRTKPPVPPDFGSLFPKAEENNV